MTRYLSLVVAMLAVTTAAGAQSRSALAGCPPADSLRAPAGALPEIHIDGPIRARYVTFVVDSQYVIPNQPRGPAPHDSGGASPLAGLDTSDIASVELVSGATAAKIHWSSCPGVPVALIVTRSKRWRPGGAGRI